MCATIRYLSIQGGATPQGHILERSRKQESYRLLYAHVGRPFCWSCSQGSPGKFDMLPATMDPNEHDLNDVLRCNSGITGKDSYQLYPNEPTSLAE